MSTTLIPFNAADASDQADLAADLALDRMQDELAEEHAEAVALAREYADHLSAGGDPTWYPKPTQRDRHQHGLARVARVAVFDAWNQSRERRSVSYPWGQHQPYQWLVQEYLLDRLGQPVPVADLRKIGQTARGGSPAEVAAAAWSIQVDTRGELRVRKTKLDGKVAWLVRPAVPGHDDLYDIGYREGVYGTTALDEESIAAALERPFKRNVHEYPSEVPS